MPADITEQLIQMITGASNPNQVAAWTATSAIQSNIADDLSLVANYAQVFGTAAPATQALAESIIGSAATAAAASGATLEQQIAAIQSFLDASAASAVATSGVVTFLAVFVAVLTILATSSGESAQQQEFQDLQDIFEGLNAIFGVDLGTYWNDKLTTGDLASYWANVQSDLDDIASETTAGHDVLNNVNNYHDDAQRFVILLVSDIGSGGFWSVPAQPAGNIPQSSSSGLASFGSGWAYRSWYGQFPARGGASGPPGDNVPDPVTMLPFLALGLQAYMLIESLVYTINPATQNTLPQFVSDFRLKELKGYLNFIYGNYQMAVDGIMKTDLPSEEEMLGTLWYLTQIAGVFAHPSSSPNQPTSQSWGAPWPFPRASPGAAFSGDGYAWNGDYGASLTYPQYGYYGDAQQDPAQLNLFTPAYIVSVPDTTNAVSQWQQANILFKVGSETYVSMDSLGNWVIPWLQNRLILGRMARWKALYILNGFDAVWSVIQTFQQLAGLNDVPTPTMNLKQDNMIASGDWWSRELCEAVLISGNLLAGNDYVSANNQFIIHTFNPAGVPVTGHSIGGLLDFLYNVGNGNWAGPPQLGADQGPPRPLSFRGLLASAAA